MASTQGNVDFILEQIARAGCVHARKMFGEYAVYCDGKVTALVCDDQLFVKQTAAGRALLGDVVEASPYPGAKRCFLISGELWDDGAFLTKLFRLTASELPTPKPKKARNRSR